MFHIAIEILEVFTGLFALIYINRHYKKLSIMTKKECSPENYTKDSF